EPLGHALAFSTGDSPSADQITGVSLTPRAAHRKHPVHLGYPQSRVTETARGTCIYSFVLHAPPVALEEVEGALDAQRTLLQSELATLKSLMERWWSRRSKTSPGRQSTATATLSTSLSESCRVTSTVPGAAHAMEP